MTKPGLRDSLITRSFVILCDGAGDKGFFRHRIADRGLPRIGVAFVNSFGRTCHFSLIGSAPAITYIRPRVAFAQNEYFNTSWINRGVPTVEVIAVKLAALCTSAKEGVAKLG